MSGKCLIQIKKAKLTRDVNLLLDMCPNYEVHYKGERVIKGPAAYMGKEPVWNDFTTVDHNI